MKPEWYKRLERDILFARAEYAEAAATRRAPSTWPGSQAAWAWFCAAAARRYESRASSMVAIANPERDGSPEFYWQKVRRWRASELLQQEQSQRVPEASAKAEE